MRPAGYRRDGRSTRARETETESESMSPPSLPLGTIVIHKSRAYRFCGVTPASIQPTMALLKDLHTGFLTEVPFTEIQPRRQSQP